MAAEIRVEDNPSHLQYELFFDDQPVGVLRYRRLPDALALVHTEVEPGFEGHGLATRLIELAFADIRARGLHVVPVCGLVREYLERHPEDFDLVVADNQDPD